jgi:hypothetical protein
MTISLRCCSQDHHFAYLVYFAVNEPKNIA